MLLSQELLKLLRNLLIAYMLENITRSFLACIHSAFLSIFTETLPVPTCLLWNPLIMKTHFSKVKQTFPGNHWNIRHWCLLFLKPTAPASFTPAPHTWAWTPSYTGRVVGQGLGPVCPSAQQLTGALRARMWEHEHVQQKMMTFNSDPWHFP